MFSFSGPIIKKRLWLFASTAPQYSRFTGTTDLIKTIRPGDQALVVLDSRSLTSKTRASYHIGRLDFAPNDRLSVYGTFISSPVRTSGATLGFQTSSTDAFYYERYPFQGGYTPAWQTALGATFYARSNIILSFRGGHTYLNDKGGSYDIPVDTPLVSISAPCPANKFSCGAGTTTTGLPTIRTNFLTQYDITRRTNLNFDASFDAEFVGRHIFKAGYQSNLIGNRVLSGNSGGQFSFFFDRAFFDERGSYGSYIVTEFYRSGDVSSSNQGFYFQDAWRIRQRLTLNLGLRFEKEFLPSFPVNAQGHPDIPAGATILARPIDFGWSDKIAPRLGVAWDVSGNGKLMLSSSFSIFYDTMKYGLPRGLFGGEINLVTYRKLEQPDFRGISLTNQPGATSFAARLTSDSRLT